MASSVGNIQNNRLAYLYIMPTIIVLGMVVLYPFLYNIVLSFSNMNLSHFNNWKITGFGNFISVFRLNKKIPKAILQFLKAIFLYAFAVLD